MTARSESKSDLVALKHKIARNEFEKVVLSGLDGKDVTCFNLYFLSEVGKPIWDEMQKSDFLSAWKRVFNVPRPEFPKAVKSDIGSNFELDCCVVFKNQERLSTVFYRVVSGDESKIYTLNQDQPAGKDILIDLNDSILFEFTEQVSYAPKQIWQIERALRLRESCIDGLPMPKAAGIIVNGANGQHHEFVAAINAIDKNQWRYSDVPKVFGVPFFVIFSPYRNVYTEIADLKTEIAAKFSFLTDAIIWSNMTLESLRTTAIAKGVSNVDTMTKEQIFLALMSISAPPSQEALHAPSPVSASKLQVCHAI
jgi:hypothetical protein